MLSIIIPAKDEEQSIANTITEIDNALHYDGCSYEIIVVDDGSVDNTANIAQAIEDVRVVKHPYNRGYGASLKTGMSKAIGDTIIITDADGTYQPNDIPRLLNYIEDYDMVIGARTNKGAKIPLYRKPAKWFLTKLASYLAKVNIPDLNSGMRIFKKVDMEKFRYILPSGFSFTTTSTLSYLCNDLTIKYVPIEYHARVGRSKIKPFRDGFNFILLILRVITYFNPLRIFIPAAFTLLLMSILTLVLSLTFLDTILDSTIVALFIAAIQVGIFGLLADSISKRKID